MVLKFMDALHILLAVTNAFVTAGHCLDLSQQPNVTLVAVHILTSRGLIKIPASNIKFFLHNKINLDKRENDLGKFEITADNFAADIHPYNLITSEIDLPEVVKIELWKSDEPGDFRIEIFKVKTLNMKICRSRFEGAPSVQKAIDRAERGEILPFMCLDIEIKQGNSGGPIKTSLGVLSTNSLGGSNGTNHPTLCVKHPSNYQDDNIWTEIHLN
ncbi:unnamed protein product [Chironomus riparius]|uniref:Peptidase S1 domain-containing protein n=1 Tax=Chironomus riparius TaxID=315576 RepID=A0A9N9RY61_9DIPT|nr:unnamed protein product [Chironomus riparius]